MPSQKGALFSQQSHNLVSISEFLEVNNQGTMSGLAVVEETDGKKGTRQYSLQDSTAVRRACPFAHRPQAFSYGQTKEWDKRLAGVYGGGTFLPPVQWVSLDSIKKLRELFPKGRFRNWFVVQRARQLARGVRQDSRQDCWNLGNLRSRLDAISLVYRNVSLLPARPLPACDRSVRPEALFETPL